MKKANLVMALALTLAMGSAVAGDKKDPERFCSPGWYKNNGLDTWFVDGASCGLDAPLTCNDLLAGLESNRNTLPAWCDGLSPGECKNAAADYIEFNLIDPQKDRVCDEYPTDD